jgi:hypothetical protein
MPRHPIIAVSLVFLCAVAKAAPDASIRWHDQSRYRDTGVLRFLVQVGDEEGPIEDLDMAQWTLIYRERQVEATTDVKSFRGAGSATAVLTVIASNGNFRGAEDEESAEQKMKAPLEYAVDAVNSLKTRLGSYLLSVACYDEVRREPTFLLMNKVASSAGSLSFSEVERQCKPPASESRAGLPKLPSLLLAACQRWAQSASASPDVPPLRYVLVIITDGNSDEAVQENWIAPFQSRFGRDVPGWFELYVIALDDGGDATNYQALARRGRLEVAKTRQDIGSATQRATPQIVGTGIYDVSFYVKETLKGESVQVAVAVQPPTGKKIVSQNWTLVGLQRKTDILRVAILVAIGIVVVLIIFVVARLIISLIKARRQRKAEEEERARAYVGPIKGRLIVRDGPVVGQCFDIVEDAVYIGRSPENQMVIPDPTVSKRHAVIRIIGNTFEVEDLQSSSGTYINGQLVRKGNLKDGDSVRVGATELEFRLS